MSQSQDLLISSKVVNSSLGGLRSRPALSGHWILYPQMYRRAVLQVACDLMKEKLGVEHCVRGFAFGLMNIRTPFMKTSAVDS